MKQVISVLLAFLLCICLFAGCKQEPTPPAMVPETTAQPRPQPEATEDPVETLPPPVSASAQSVQAADELPYLETISQADQSVFSGPGYGYDYVGTVRSAGIYTITEEAWDEIGNLWGKLKSGMGWVDLSDIRTAAQIHRFITANYADLAQLPNGDYYHCVADASEYTVRICFRVTEESSDMSFFTVIYADGFQIAETLYEIPQWKPDAPFIADVCFPGDMSMFGIRFTDAGGTVRCYTVSISGRDGSLVLTEHEPQ